MRYVLCGLNVKADDETPRKNYRPTENYRLSKVAIGWKRFQPKTYEVAAQHVADGYVAGIVPEQHGILTLDIDGFTDSSGAQQVDPAPLLELLAGVEHCHYVNPHTGKSHVHVRFNGEAPQTKWSLTPECSGDIRHADGYVCLWDWEAFHNSWTPGKAVDWEWLASRLEVGVKARQKVGIRDHSGRHTRLFFDVQSAYAKHGESPGAVRAVEAAIERAIDSGLPRDTEFERQIERGKAAGLGFRKKIYPQDPSVTVVRLQSEYGDQPLGELAARVPYLHKQSFSLQNFAFNWEPDECDLAPQDCPAHTFPRLAALNFIGPKSLPMLDEAALMLGGMSITDFRDELRELRIDVSLPTIRDWARRSPLTILRKTNTKGRPGFAFELVPTLQEYNQNIHKIVRDEIDVVQEDSKVGGYKTFLKRAGVAFDIDAGLDCEQPSLLRQILDGEFGEAQEITPAIYQACAYREFCRLFKLDIASKSIITDTTGIKAQQIKPVASRANLLRKRRFQYVTDYDMRSAAKSVGLIIEPTFSEHSTMVSRPTADGAREGGHVLHISYAKGSGATYKAEFPSEHVEREGVVCMTYVEFAEAKAAQAELNLRAQYEAEGGDKTHGTIVAWHQTVYEPRQARRRVRRQADPVLKKARIPKAPLVTPTEVLERRAAVGKEPAHFLRRACNRIAEQSDEIYLSKRRLLYRSGGYPAIDSYTLASVVELEERLGIKGDFTLAEAEQYENEWYEAVPIARPREEEIISEYQMMRQRVEEIPF